MEVARLGRGHRPGNVACAVAVALELGVAVDEIARRIGSLPTAPHRLESTTAAGGFVVLDDTYNANPTGARAALQALERAGSASGRRVVVTPGMVELGRHQAEENARFARAAVAVADDLVIVGRTNRRALVAGAHSLADGPAAGVHRDGGPTSCVARRPPRGGGGLGPGPPGCGRCRPLRERSSRPLPLGALNAAAPSSTTATTAVIFGGPSPEHDVSILTGLQVARTLSEAGREVFGLYWSKTGDWFRVPATLEAADFVDGIPRRSEPLRLAIGTEGGFSEPGGRLGRSRPVDLDVAVVCCHGGPGEDGTLQGALDLAGIRYTGPAAAAAALGMDKLAFAGVVADAGLPTLSRRLLGTTTTELGFPGPYIVKPRYGGSSLGIDVVEDMATAVARLEANPHLRQGAVVEPYRPDLFDLNIAVRLWPDAQLSAIERPLRSTGSAEILNYSDKYVGGEGMASAPRELPAQLPEALTLALRSAALEIARLVALRGVARIDFLSDGDGWFVNEVNTVPGSLARYLWVDPPLAFIELLDAMIGEALARPTWRPSAMGADGTVLRSAGGIAAKLG